MLVSFKEMLSDAKNGHYAIPAFDFGNYEMLMSILEACEESRSPALLQVLGVDLQGRCLPILTAMVQEASKHFSIPVCLHLDHGESFEAAKRACDAGFSSVMFDGSKLPLAENIEKTRAVVEYSHARGLSVEAELGHVCDGMVGNGENNTQFEDPEHSLTVPAEAAEFVEKTGVDALAVAIGTAHGVYFKTPTLRIDRLDEITAVCDCPLVLHGGSGTPYDQLHEAIDHGITKINIYSDVLAAMSAGLKDTVNSLTNPATWPVVLYEESKKRMREVLLEKINTFGSANRV